MPFQFIVYRDIICRDIVYFDTNRAPRPGDLAIVRDANGRLLVRRYREVDNAGTFTLVADSADWPNITTSVEAGDYELVGSVITYTRGSIIPEDYRQH